MEKRNFELSEEYIIFIRRGLLDLSEALSLDAVGHDTEEWRKRVDGLLFKKIDKLRQHLVW